MGKVAIVGVEGSGKTVLMAGLCECYQQVSAKDLYLMPENKAAHMFMTQVPHKLRVKREWPAATSIDALRYMKWTLRRGQTIVEEIEMLDYPGELYRMAFDDEASSSEVESKSSELNEFLAHLTDAKVLVVLLNLSNLENPGDNPRNAETIWLTRKIFDYASQIPSIERMMLVFTQADRYAEQLRAAGGPQALYERDLPMMHVLYPHLLVTAVSAVDRVDAENHPCEGFSSESCVELMNLILNDLTLNIPPGYVKKIRIAKDVEMIFVWCAPGSFLMGSPENEEGRGKDERQHSVTLSKGFFIGRYPVTQQQWELLTGDNSSGNKVGGFLGFGGATRPNHPVEHVSRNDIIGFINRLNTWMNSGKFRLPTEAEWEYACRAGSTGPYAGSLDEMAWHGGNSADSSHEVGRKKPNNWGIYDMHGNVWEWCADNYCSEYSQTSSDSIRRDKSGRFVIRGGSFRSEKGSCRSAERFNIGAGNRFAVCGIRLVFIP